LISSLTPPGPSTISVTQSTDAERITSLESRVKELENQNLLLAQQVTQQSTSYNTLLQTHTTLLADFTTLRLKLDSLESLVLRVHSGQSAQGEMMIYHEACKEDELVKKKRDDKDDDPDVQKDGEPTGPSRTGEQAIIQGESESVSVAGDGAGTSAVGTSEAGKTA
jgi:hypothetical protein